MSGSAKLRYATLFRDVERHYLVAAAAVTVYHDALREGRIAPKTGDVRTVRELAGVGRSNDPGELEATFLIRLFAAFEEGCRRCRIDRYRKSEDDRIGTEVLIDWLAGKAAVLTAYVEPVHRVRRYRNDLLHLNREQDPVRFADARTALGKYLSCLPENWR